MRLENIAKIGVPLTLLAGAIYLKNSFYERIQGFIERRYLNRVRKSGL
jgi:hypothetical protein